MPLPTSAAAQLPAQELLFLLERTSDFVLVARADGTVVYVNPAGRRLSGIGPDDPLPGHYRDFCPAWVQETLFRAATEASRRGESAVGEGALLGADGREVPVPFVVVVDRDADGRAQIITTIARDISEQKRAEAALRESEERFRVAQELSLDAFTILDAVRDDNGRIRDFVWRYVNPAAARILGDTREQLEGQRLLERLPGNATQSDLFARYVRVAETGEPHDVEVAYEADGIRGWFRNMTVRLGDGVAIAFADITPRKEAEAALRASEAEFRSIFEMAATGVAQACPKTGAFIRVNQRMCEITGYSEAELLRMTVADVTNPDDQAMDLEIRRTALSDLSREWTYEKRYRRKDGTVRWVLITARLLSATDRTEARTLAIVQDIHDRKMAEEALRRSEAALRLADQRKDEFLAMLAHELRAPLAPIRSAVDVCRRSGDEPAITRQMHMVVERQVGLLARLVDDLLDVARITENKITLRREVLTIADVVERALETSRPVIDAAGHTLSVDLPAEAVYVDADGTRLAQAVANLLNNASKFTDRGGTITLTVRHEGARVRLAVRDSGVGMTADEIPHVFELFTQTAPAVEGARGGLGVGLTLVKRLVELHGGTVAAESAGRGHGSEFRIELPVVAAPAATATDGPRPTPSQQSRRVLVVDDNADAAQCLATYFELVGHDVRTAGHARAAIAEATRFRPDAVLLDLGLPGIDGLQLATQLRQLPETAGACMIAVTGYGRPEDRARALAAGFDHHVTKPADPEALDVLIRAPRRA